MDEQKPIAPAPVKAVSPQTYEKHWHKDGKAHGAAPKWAKYHTDMASEFPLPYRGGADPLAHQVKKFVEKLDLLRPEKDGPAFLGKSGALTYTYPDVKNVKINQKMGDLDAVLDDVVELFDGAPNWGSPLTMCNVIPQANTAAIIASMLSQVFSVNILEGEYAQNVHRAELETAGMLGNLMGWNPVEAGAIYTWGGGGCWTYGVKYGLTRVLPNSRTAGIRTDAKVICSQQAHFVQKNATDWMGLGSDNIVHVRTDIDTNQMDVAHLEEILKDLTAKKIPVSTIVCTMGTTDASAIDPIREVRALLDRYPNPEGYGKAVLYADAVVGWSWIYFKDYDFDLNPLEFSDRILPILKKNGQALKDLSYADAVGIDFHKVGWASSTRTPRNSRPSTAGAATPTCRSARPTIPCTIPWKCHARPPAPWPGGRRSNTSAWKACKPSLAAFWRRNITSTTCWKPTRTWSASIPTIQASSRSTASIPTASMPRRSTPKN